MRSLIRRLAGAALTALVLAGACSPRPDRTDSPSTVSSLRASPVAATVRLAAGGRFECGHAVHGCTAWFAIRPAGWQPAPDWAPGREDTEIRAAGDMRGNWVVTEPLRGGPGVIQPGRHTLALAFTEISDTEPLVLGTDEEPGTGIVTTTIACMTEAAVPEGTQQVDVLAFFGPECRIDVTVVPPD